MIQKREDEEEEEEKKRTNGNRKAEKLRALATPRVSR
jgi:hypothetical protein